MEHLMERYGKIQVSNIEAWRQALEKPTEVDRHIDVYFQHMGYTIQFAQYGKTPFTSNRISQAAYHTVNKTGLYSLDLK